MILSEIIDGKVCRKEISAPNFTKDVDLIVCGLGTAGSLAALFSAENGLSVLGVENFTCLGGTHTAGGVPYHYFGNPGGRYEALDQEIKEFSKKFAYTETEGRKLLLEQKLFDNGVEILYNSSVCGVYLEENRIVGLRVLTEEGFCDLSAKVVMDCTADARVASIAGCKTEMGRETDGQMQPYSVVYMVSDGKNYGFTNVDFGRVNQFDRKSLSEAILYARSHKPTEDHDCEPIAQMPLLGLREGCRIIAEEGVSLQDLFDDKQTETPAFYSYADLDKHGWDIAFDSELLGDWAIGANLGAYNLTVAVPYKAILPQGFEGLLVPCRALGVDRDISSCVRMNPDMKKVAEVAAEWATLAVKQCLSLRNVNYADLKEKLTESGCLKTSDNRGCRIDGIRNAAGDLLPSTEVRWITDPDGLEDRLKTDKPGEAIWSAKRMGKTALPTLLVLLNSKDKNTSRHTAFALAILGEKKAISLLRKMVFERDDFMLRDCRKNNNIRGCVSIYWLGRLGDREIVDELIGIITNKYEIQKAVYQQKDLQTTRYKVKDFEDVYFQFVSESVMALIRIGDLHEDLRPKISDAFTFAFSSEEYYHRFTKRDKLSSEGNMVLALKNVAFDAVKRWIRQSK